MTKKTEKKNASIGLVLVTHGSFGKDLVESAQFILGPQEMIFSVSVPPQAGGDEILGEIKNAVKKCDQGGGVLVLTDLFGGTPTTLSLSLLKKHNIEVVAGVNLPLLIKAVQSRELPMSELAEVCRKAGRTGIIVAGQMLKRRAS